MLKESDDDSTHIITRKISNTGIVSDNSLAQKSTQPVGNTTANRRAPRMEKQFISGGRRPSVIAHNNAPVNKPSKEQIRTSLRDTHLESLKERAALAAQEKKDSALAATPAPEKKSLSTTAGATPAATPTPNIQGDYRRKLLALAKSEAINAEEPWKELIAIAFAQNGIQDTLGARDTLKLASRLTPATNTNGEQSRHRLSMTQAFASLGEIELALDQAALIKEESPKNNAYASLINTHVSRREFSEAKALVSSITAPAQQSNALRTIAEGEASIGDERPALSTASLISNLSLRNDALGRIAQALARSQQWDSAMATVSLINDREANQRALANVIRTRIDSGDIMVAQNAIWSIQDESSRNDLFSRISNKHASQGNLSAGMQTAELITDKPTQERTLASVSLQQARLGDTSGAFSQARTFATQSVQTDTLRDVALVEASQRGTYAGCNMAALIENPEARDAAFRAIAQREASVGNLSEAINCVQNIQAQDCRVLTMADSALASIQRNATREAIRVLEDTTQLITSIEIKNNKRNEAIRKIAHAFALIGRIDECLGNISHLPNQGQRDSTYEQISLDCVNKNMIENAQNLANRITSQDKKKKCLENIALIYARHVDPKDASKEVRRFDTEEQRSQFLRGIATKG